MVQTCMCGYESPTGVRGMATHILASTPLIVFGREARHMNTTVRMFDVPE
jgi:hypothetical protein